MENYIVRIYRHEKDRPHRLMGIVETVGEEGKKAFTRYDELWEILNAQTQRAGEEGGAKATGNKGKRQRG